MSVPLKIVFVIRLSSSRQCQWRPCFFDVHKSQLAISTCRRMRVGSHFSFSSSLSLIPPVPLFTPAFPPLYPFHPFSVSPLNRPPPPNIFHLPPFASSLTPVVVVIVVFISFSLSTSALLKWNSRFSMWFMSQFRLCERKLHELENCKETATTKDAIFLLIIYINVTGRFYLLFGNSISVIFKGEQHSVSQVFFFLLCNGWNGVKLANWIAHKQQCWTLQ